jgi:hypothetical protein
MLEMYAMVRRNHDAGQVQTLWGEDEWQNLLATSVALSVTD